MLLPILLGSGAVSAVALILYIRSRRLKDENRPPMPIGGGYQGINIQPMAPRSGAGSAPSFPNTPRIPSRYAERNSVVADDTSDTGDILAQTLTTLAIIETLDNASADTYTPPAVEPQPYVAPEPAYSAPEPCYTPDPTPTYSAPEPSYSAPDTSFSCDTSSSFSSPSFD